MSKAELSKRVMRAVALSQPRPKLARDSDGNAPIVISLPNENVSDVFARAKRAAKNDAVNIIIAYSGNYEVLRFDGSVAPDAAIDVNGDLSMGMLSIKLNNNPGKSIRVNVRGETIDVPAASSFAYA
ncbi:hypothetical protein [Microbacterium maritypicum]|uniref:hypothetical protein n=1 Tax=Microbacterium maritypicum TaxID=33918 RepID=UPI0038089489